MCRSSADGGRRCPGHKTYYSRKVVSEIREKMEKESKKDWDSPLYDKVRTRLYNNMMKIANGEVEVGTLSDFVNKSLKCGSTYNVNSGEFAALGFCVSPYPERSLAVNVNDLTRDKLFDVIEGYKEKNADLLGQENSYMGSWIDMDTDTLYIDVSVVVPKAEEARTISLEKDQKAFFDMQVFTLDSDSDKSEVTVDKEATSGQGAKLEEDKNSSEK